MTRPFFIFTSCKIALASFSELGIVSTRLAFKNLLEISTIFVFKRLKKKTTTKQTKKPQTMTKNPAPYVNLFAVYINVTNTGNERIQT